ncbi:hypothetical protein KC329_g90 [Hortaea werneckii]|nr:hypothetical protein KC329_g90 [Hortaea werneckii]
MQLTQYAVTPWTNAISSSDTVHGYPSTSLLSFSRRRRHGFHLCLDSLQTYLLSPTVAGSSSATRPSPAGSASPCARTRAGHHIGAGSAPMLDVLNAGNKGILTFTPVLAIAPLF